MAETQVVALGGNALIRPGEEGLPAQQMQRASEVARLLAPLASGGLVVTHGNGPQVGRLLLRSDLLVDRIPALPLDHAVAMTQGAIGWMLQRGFVDALGSVGDGQGNAVTLLTQVVVDRHDPAFGDPTKYVGQFYTEEEAKHRAAALGWQVKEDKGRGWRRVVPSPMPCRIVEAQAIASLAEQGTVVIACGGGGVPVVEHQGRLTGIEAVIDKDNASALLAQVIGARRFTILTGVDQVQLDFGTPKAQPVSEATADTARRWLEEGQFPPGSMGPKIASALHFLERGGEEVLITSPERLEDAWRGLTGTLIRR